MTSDLDQLRTYISDYAVAASRKLRDQHSVCLSVSTFLSTNPHRDDLDQYSNIATVRLNVASADCRVITNAAISALESIYREGLQYKRAGVLLNDITTDEAIMLDLFESNPEQMAKSKKLMSTLDELTSKYGMDSVKLGVQGFEKTKPNLTNFQPSLNQTSNLSDIITVR